MMRHQRGVYVGQISNLLHVGAPYISERLIVVQRFGIAKWKRARKRNMKVYSMGFHSLGIEFEPSGAVLRRC
ncbi:MAG: hypothetical protein JRN20_16095 [Nitrososphaerota archaeon]|nr:hypothetical protein [Nitrososphaerota archaeon]MDG6922280.1 hypothetical protein [Nitrososphaerota archaeon]